MKQNPLDLCARKFRFSLEKMKLPWYNYQVTWLVFSFGRKEPNSWAKVCKEKSWVRGSAYGEKLPGTPEESPA